MLNLLSILFWQAIHAFCGHPEKYCYNLDEEYCTVWCTKCKQRITYADHVL